MRKIMRTTALAVSAVMFTAALAGCSTTSNDDGGENPDYPQEQVTIYSPFDPGGGIDLAINTVIQSLTTSGTSDADMRLSNIPGGSGLVAISQLAADNDGDDAALLLTSVSTLSASVRNPNEPGIDLLTPLGGLYAEYTYVYVPGTSDYESIADIAADLESDPGSVVISGASLGSADNIVLAQFATELGIDFDQLTYLPLTGDENAASLLGGQVDVTFGGPDLLDLSDSGDVRVLAVSAPERIDNPRVSEIPTFAEEGYEGVAQSNWRGLFGPPNMPDHAVEYWDTVLQEMYTTDEWQEAAEQNVWDTMAYDRETFIDFLDDQKSTLTEILGNLDLIE